MKTLIKSNEFGISVLNKDESIVISSRTVAEVFGKVHASVLRDIRELQEKLQLLFTDGKLDNLGRYKFVSSSYINLQGKKQPEVLLNKRAFTMLVMGYTSKNALTFKDMYITKFEEMEQQLYHLKQCRMECPRLTSALQRLDTGSTFVYSNEFNMINKIVLGCSTKDFRELHGIKKGDSIRPYCTDEQLKAIRHLQNYDSVLVDVIKDYKLRKAQLELYYKDVYLNQ